ncbi:MAG: sec-independent protein translocase protein TatC [Candidatus Omnitrophota bacterium]|jgi:sec-independent protein translocase protein TatC
MMTALEDRKPVTEHIDDLRGCIIRVVISVFTCALVSLLFSNALLTLFTEPARAAFGKLHFFAPADAFIVKLQVSIISGLIIASPYVILQIWTYIAPGLYKHERQMLLPWIALSAFLFLVGATFAFKLVLPLALSFLMGFQTNFMEPVISITHYMSFLSSMITAFGIAFNMPIFILACVALNLVQVETLSKFRRHAYVASFILAMALTPPDMISQVLLALPLIVLYELSILGSRFIKKRKK